MQTDLKIGSMSCEACVSHVTRALQSVAGVDDAVVNLQNGSAQVQHNAQTSPQALIDAVVEDGYEAQLAEPSG